MADNKNPLKRIFDILKLEKTEISAIYLYAIMNGLIQLSLPVGVQSIIGFVLGASIRASLYVLIFLIILGVLISGILQINQMKIIEKVQQKLFVRYSFDFANHIPVMDLKKNDALYFPELVNRFFDVPVLQKSLSKILLDIPTAFIQIIVGLLLLTFYHPAFILFGLLLLIVLLLILKLTWKNGIETSYIKSKYKYRVAAWLEELARVVKTTRNLKTFDLHLKKTDQEVSNYLNARNKHFKVLLFQYYVLVIFKTIITASMLIVGTFLMVKQQLSIGQFIAAEIVILLVTNSVEKLITNFGSIYDTLTAVEKASEIMDKPIEKNGNILIPDEKNGIKIDLKNVSFQYAENQVVLKNINLEIKPNEKILIKGFESAGKSTLLKLLSGLYRENEGSLLVNEIPLANYDIDSYRSQVGMMLNKQDIFDGTLLENITLGNPKATIENIMWYCKHLGLSDFIATLPNGYETVLDPFGNRLPRNIINRLLILRSLAHNPRLLLLEDPLIGITEQISTQFVQLLKELKNVTIIIVSNDERFNEISDHIYFLNHDKMLIQEK